MRKSNSLFEDIQFDDEFLQFIEKLLNDFENNPKLYKEKKNSFLEINVANKHGDTILHFAARNNKKDKKSLSVEEVHLQKQFIRFLLRSGAQVNKKNKYCETALDYALKDRLYPLATLLIKWGGDIEARLDNKTWIHRAIEQEDYALAEYLLKMGADCQAKYGQNSYSETPLHLIAQKKLPEIWWKLFIDYGAGILTYFPKWSEYALNYEKFSLNSFFYRFRINLVKDTCWLSRKMPSFEKSCGSIADLEESINSGVRYNLKAFIRVVINLQVDKNKDNPLFRDLLNNLKRLKIIQDAKHHQRVKPLTKLALKQLLHKPVIELPEEIFIKIENEVDTLEGKLNKKIP